MSTSSESVRSFFARLNAAREPDGTSLATALKGGFLDSVETVLKERDDLLDACS